MLGDYKAHVPHQEQRDDWALAGRRGKTPAARHNMHEYKTEISR